MAAAPLIRVFITDSRPLVLKGLADLVDTRKPLMAIIGQATGYSRAIELVDLLRPEVVLFSFFRDSMNALEALKALIHLCNAKVLVFKGADDSVPVEKAMELGARGVILAEESIESIVESIIRVSHVTSDSGKAWIDGLARLAAGSHGDARARQDADYAKLARLTARELDLIDVLVRNPSAKYFAIGSLLGISEHTVHNHLTSIYQKLELVNRIDLLVFAVQHQLGTENRTPMPPGSIDPQGTRSRAVARKTH